MCQAFDQMFPKLWRGVLTQWTPKTPRDLYFPLLSTPCHAPRFPPRARGCARARVSRPRSALCARARVCALRSLPALAPANLNTAFELQQDPDRAPLNPGELSPNPAELG